jgi:predicted DNA-binding protein YlxM (UPF0122 family)
MNEIWVDIKGFEGKYQLSNKGQVLSLNFNNTGKPKLLKIRKNHYGFNEVTLSKNNKRKFYLLITLVAEHFLEKPAPDMIPIHIGEIDDDSVENIAYGYRSEMLHLMYKKGHRVIGEPSENIVSYKGKQYKSFSEMAKDYGIDRKNFDKRVKRGWTLEETLEIPMKRKKFILNKRLYEYNGKLYSVEELSELSGISTKTIYKRLKRKWSVEETVEIPVGKRKEGN